MKRAFLAVCLLSASGLAAGQSGGVIIIGGPIEVAPITDPGTVITPGDFQLIFHESTSRVFLISNFSSMVNAAGRQDAAPAFLVAPDPGTMLHGQAPIVTIEEEGVRLPDEQFSLP